MRIVFNGHDFDLDDAETRAMAARQYAEQIQLARNDADSVRDYLDSLTAQLVDYWLQASATLAMAAGTGSDGISLAQAQEMNNFIGGLIGQGAMDVLTPEQRAEAELLKTGPQRIVLPD